MRFSEILSGAGNHLTEAAKRRGDYTSSEAKAVGDCAIKAIAAITGLSWDTVWEAARPHFGRYGMNAGDQWATLNKLGWESQIYCLPGATRGEDMSVRQAEAWLREHDPNVRLLCSINVGGMPHAIAFADAKFHNVQGAYRAKIRLAYAYRPTR